MILVCGATGNIGSALVEALVAADEPVRALVRQADRAPAGAEAVVGDLHQPETFLDALSGVDGLFMLSGYNDEDKLLAAAQTAEVRHVALLSSASLDGTDTTNAGAFR
ncbi:SDR family oxidoreductase [Kribbella deserti]|uniref:SDR family oxidoreductase n=1 Tax=Kribbella deserti TaxID=1926257 RepID=A0ABV6QI88_9ACTN